MIKTTFFPVAVLVCLGAQGQPADGARPAGCGAPDIRFDVKTDQEPSRWREGARVFHPGRFGFRFQTPTDHQVGH